MKTSTIVLCALALSTAFTAVKVSAVSTSTSAVATLSFSGTADFFKTNYVKVDYKGTNVTDTHYVYTTVTRSLNNKYVYNLVSNAVANVGIYDTNLVSTNLPSNGYITFSSGTDGNIFGFFYITNKTGFYWPLSGTYLTTNGIPIPVTITNYYSFIELDTTVPYFTIGSLDGYLGFDGNVFNDVFSDNVDEKTLDSSPSSTSTGVLYIHDNPLSFDLPAGFSIFQTNSTAIEVSGVFKFGLTYKDGNITHGSGTLRGSGNIIVTGNTNYENGVLTSGTAALKF